MRIRHSTTRTPSTASSSSHLRMAASPGLRLSSNAVSPSISSLGKGLIDYLLFDLSLNTLISVLALPDGTVLMIANNQTIIYDIEKNTETILPDIPNGVRVTNPFDGTAALLPLSPPLYTPEVLVCGGSASDENTPSEQLSSQDPASDQCSRLELTPAGIKRGWQIERMSDPRMMPEMILLPNGEILITNGGRTGYAAVASVGDPVGNMSNADHPVYVFNSLWPL
jgi:hypothetical protein